MFKTNDRVYFFLPNLDFNKVLLTRFVFSDGRKGVWNLPGGGNESDESPIDTGLRELSEETGLEQNDLSQIILLHEERIDIKKIYIFGTKLFNISKVKDTHIDPDSGMPGDIKWFSIDDIRNLSYLTNAVSIVENNYIDFMEKVKQFCS